VHLQHLGPFGRSNGMLRQKLSLPSPPFSNSCPPSIACSSIHSTMPDEDLSYATGQQQHNMRGGRRSHSGSRERKSGRSRHGNGHGNGARERQGDWPRLRAHLVAMSGEFIGTVLFLWFAFAGTQVAAMSNPSGSVLQPQSIVFIALSFGMSLLVVAWAFYRISGGLFNPAVRTANLFTNLC
jgi:Major intrinsic protein